MAKNAADRIADELAKVLPPETIATAYNFVGKVADAFNMVDEVIVKAHDKQEDNKKSQSIYDDVRNDVGNPPGSFEDIVAGWNTQPDATSGGRVDYLTFSTTVNNLCKTLNVPTYLSNEDRAAAYERKPWLVDEDITFLNGELAKQGAPFRLSSKV